MNDHTPSFWETVRTKLRMWTFWLRYVLAWRIRGKTRSALTVNRLPFEFRFAVEAVMWIDGFSFTRAMAFCTGAYILGDSWMVGEGWRSEALPRLAAEAFYNHEFVRRKFYEWMLVHNYDCRDIEELLDFLETIDHALVTPPEDEGLSLEEIGDIPF